MLKSDQILGLKSGQILPNSGHILLKSGQILANSSGQILANPGKICSTS